MRYRFASCSMVLVLIGIAFAQAPTTADSPACGARANNTLDKLLDCVTVDGMMAHLGALQAIADANLTGVTSADVGNLIPVVSESLSMGAPTAGDDAALDGNVWASGAATAAFDAFGDAERAKDLLLTFYASCCNAATGRFSTLLC